MHISVALFQLLLIKQSPGKIITKIHQKILSYLPKPRRSVMLEINKARPNIT